MTVKERRIKSDLTRLDASDVSSADYDDAPELTEEQLAEAATAPAARGRGRPPIPSPKVPVKIRLDASVLEGYRATGPGWQTRINEVLGEALISAAARMTESQKTVRRKSTRLIVERQNDTGKFASSKKKAKRAAPTTSARKRA